MRKLMLCLAALVFLFSCQQSETLDGKQLAGIYCGSCHQNPSPSLLPKEVWKNGILPEMGRRLGMEDRNVVLDRMSFKQFDKLCQLGIYPETAAMKQEEWKKIVHYFLDNAPVKALVQDSKQDKMILANDFQLTKIMSKENSLGTTTMVKFLPDRKEIWLGERNNQISTYNLTGNKKNTFRTPSPAVDLIAGKNPLILGIGNMMPNQDRNGRLFSFGKPNKPGTLIQDSLHRPVEVHQFDMNGDGTKDLVYAEFGFETGKISWTDGKSGTHKTIHEQSGPRHLIFRDMDHDGLLDFYVLFAQAREEIILFHNKGNGLFGKEKILEFPSVHGSSYFDMSDMNGDGTEDLIVSNGDNADYSRSIKAYHGIRIYLNEGKNKYKSSYFYPVNGATKTIAADFDGDGDNDLMAIAFFSKLSDGESFLYFRNEGAGKFSISDLDVPPAHWMVMESGDMDNDGDMDVMLGNFQLEKGDEQSVMPNLQAILIENQRIRG